MTHHEQEEPNWIQKLFGATPRTRRSYSLISRKERALRKKRSKTARKSRRINQLKRRS